MSAFLPPASLRVQPPSSLSSTCKVNRTPSRVVCTLPLHADLPREPRKAAKGAQLPQDASESERAERIAVLEKQRLVYEYEAPETVPDIAFLKANTVDGLPELEMPSTVYKVKRFLAYTRIRANNAYFSWRKLDMLPLYALQRILAPFNRLRAVKAPRDTRGNVAKDFERTAGVLKAYRELFPSVPLPAIAEVFMDDATFSRLRVAGFNPMTLFAVNKGNCPFEMDEERYCLLDDTFAAALAEGRVYGLDFSALESVKQEMDTLRRFAVTKALFAVPKGQTEAKLVPLAIEVEDGIVYPPRDDEEEFPAAWVLAKLAVNVCDFMHHQVVTHLARTHLVIEAVLLATMRQLAPTHPLYRLLRPHFEGTAFINEAATSDLLDKSGPVDEVLGGTLNTGVELVTAHMNGFNFNMSFPDAELSSRGLLNRNLEMPYREDALAHFQALTTWVYDYLSLYYTDDLDVMSDYELAAWAKELTDSKLGRMSNLGDEGDGRIRTLKYLSKAVAYIIFTASCQHACVNFPQADLMLYPPAVAGFLYGEVPDFKGEVTRADWEKALSPIDMARTGQISVLSILGNVYHTQLGQYRDGELPNDRKVKVALKKYQKKLRDIGRTIERREKDEPLKYEYLKPSNIPQSVNI